MFKKIIEVYNRQTFVQSKESWSFHRFFVFFFSWSGQKRILKFLGKIVRFLKRKVIGGPTEEEFQYNKWRKRNIPGERDFKRFSNELKKLSVEPKISILLPVYKPNLFFLKAAINSVTQQVYNNWELCISDDCSNDDELISYLKEQQNSDDRIKLFFRTENGHISANSNSAAQLATGECIALLDQDDLLRKDALFQIAKQLNEKEYDILYSDEDKLSEEGRFVQPYLKPEWSPDSFLSRNYICHFTCIKKSIFDKIGGFRVGFEGSQDYDLLLRATEQSSRIKRIPHILYHWRMHAESTSQNEQAKNYAFESGVKSLTEAIERRGESAIVTAQKGKPGFYHVSYGLKKEAKISIIIPTKNNAEVLSTCIRSVFEKSSYQNFEVIVLDNNSDEPKLFELLETWKKKEPARFSSMALPYPFNFSQLMNDGVKASQGEFIVLLNNDTEVISNDWLENMLRHAQRDKTAAVGVKLYYPNDLIQHAGVVIGLGGDIAGHTFVAAEKSNPGYFHQLTSVNNYSAVTAACLMIAKEKYWEVEGFDEQLEVEYNDVDFCLKLVEKGYNNVWLPEVELYHYESLTRGHPHANSKAYARSQKEKKYFRSKWIHFIENDPMYHPNLTRANTYYGLR